MFNEEEYDLVTNIETEELLMEMPLEVIKENIRSQIDNPLSTRVDFVEPMIDKFNAIKEQYGELDTTETELKKLKTDLFSFIISALNDRFELDVVVDDDNAEQLQVVGYALYEFLILRYKKNITKFIHKFIKRNKKHLVKEFEQYYKKKDVTSITVKKKIKNKDEALIISNLPAIIKHIINDLAMDMDVHQFFDYLGDGDLYEVEIIQQLVNSGNMSDSFIDKYVELITDKYDYVLDEIQSEIRMKLLDKL